MISWKKFANIEVLKALYIKKGAVITVENADRTLTNVDVAELAALNSIAAADLAKIDGITNGTAASGKALVLGASGEIATITSATITTLTSTTVNVVSVVRTGRSMKCGVRGRVGAVAGWVLSAATTQGYVATMAASQAAGTLIVPIEGLWIGDTITGFTINAQIESAGGTVTLDAILRATTNVAADPTEADIGTTMTQVSVTADTASVTSKTGLTEVVAAGKSYYLLITGTTAAATDIILLNSAITVTTA